MNGIEKIYNHSNELGVFIRNGGEVLIAAFFHDSPLIKGKDGKYYSIGFSYSIWERYLSIFDTVIVSTRVRYEDSMPGSLNKKFMLSSGENAEFSPISEYQKSSDMIFKKKEITNQIRNSLEKSDYAIIRLPSFIGNLARDEAIKMGKPFLIEAVGCARDSLWYHSNIGKLLALPNFLAMKQAVKNSKYTIYVTKEFLQSRYPTRGESTNCSNVNLGKLDEKVLESRLKKYINKDKMDKLILGTTAAIDVKYKGQESVIKVLGMLKKNGLANFEYQLVGGGDEAYLSDVAKKYDVEEQVSFLGAMTNDNVINWLDSIDIYIQPSKTEGLPRALIEAMSRGLFCLCSNAGGMPELIDEKYIFNKSRSNQNRLFKIIKEINKEDLIEQSKRNFNKVKDYDKEIIDKRRIEFLNKFVQ